MTEDVILDVTADFIRSSEKNLGLALQVERAMPFVRAHFVTIALDSVAKCFPQPDWHIDRTPMQNVMTKNAELKLRNKDWLAGESEDTGTYITLASDLPNWKRVWVGAIFTGRFSQITRDDGQIVAPLAGRGFSFETSEDAPYLWKYLDGELRDWSGEGFLTEMLVEDGRKQIVSDISTALREMDEFVESLK